jgi:hypothetical protein
MKPISKEDVELEINVKLEPQDSIQWISKHEPLLRTGLYVLFTRS